MTQDNLEKKLKQRAYDLLGRSVFVLRIDTGSCNGCEIEVFATLTPVYDIERFGIKLVFSPKHADVLLVTGPVTRQFAPVLIRTYEFVPKPCIVVACGTCACSGGIFHDSYGVLGGVDKLIPVDTYIPGCPPSPYAILHGVLVALDILEQKMAPVFDKEAKEWNKENENLDLGGLLTNGLLIKRIYFELRRFLGYRIASKLLQEYIMLLRKENSYEIFLKKMSDVIKTKWNNDPRIIETVSVVNEKIKDMEYVTSRKDAITITKR